MAVMPSKQTTYQLFDSLAVCFVNLCRPIRLCNVLRAGSLNKLENKNQDISKNMKNIPVVDLSSLGIYFL